MSSLPLLVEPEQLNEQRQNPDLLVVDVSSDQNYLTAHVPGAVHISPRALTRGQPPLPGGLPEIPELQTLLRSLGLKPDSHVVAYDDEGGGWAGRLLWTLEVIGHTRYSYLNGGIHAWLAAGMATETGAREAVPSTFTIDRVSTEQIADKAHILGRLGADDLAIWDARGPLEYSGEKKNATKAGHIPGAVNYEWTTAMDNNRQLRLRDLEQIRSELAALGITPDKEIITHCQTHHRSGLTWLLGKILGFEDIKAYPGSWAEWGNAADTPVDN